MRDAIEPGLAVVLTTVRKNVGADDGLRTRALRR